MNRKLYHGLCCYNLILKHILTIIYSNNIQVYRQYGHSLSHFFFSLSLFSSEVTFLTSYYVFKQAFLFIFRHNLQVGEWDFSCYLFFSRVIPDIAHSTQSGLPGNSVKNLTPLNKLSFCLYI